MVEIDIPDFGSLRLRHLVLDFNGTLARDGRLLIGVRERLAALSKELTIHVLTADTFGQARVELAGVPCELSILPKDGQDVGKREYVTGLGADATVAVGNGRNDRLMLEVAALGIAVMLEEGAAVAAVTAADVVCGRIGDALDLLRHPLRLVATLRS